MIRYKCDAQNCGKTIDFRFIYCGVGKHEHHFCSDVCFVKWVLVSFSAAQNLGMAPVVKHPLETEGGAARLAGAMPPNAELSHAATNQEDKHAK